MIEKPEKMELLTSQAPKPSPSQIAFDIEVVRAVNSYTAPMILIGGEFEIGIGSAAFFQLNDNYFALTAHHNLTKSETQRIAFKCHNAPLHPNTRRYCFHPDDQCDLAIIDLDYHSDITFASFDQLSTQILPRLENEKDFDHSQLVTVCGYPWLGQKYTAEESAIDLRAHAFKTNVVLSDSRQLVLYYPERDCYGKSFHVEPHGYSGAGAWLPDYELESSLFNPQKHLKYYGLQHEWDPKTRLLKCTPAPVIREFVLNMFS